jgi:hypothetical protein
MITGASLWAAFSSAGIQLLGEMVYLVVQPVKLRKIHNGFNGPQADTVIIP